MTSQEVLDVVKRHRDAAQKAAQAAWLVVDRGMAPLLAGRCRTEEEEEAHRQAWVKYFKAEAGADALAELHRDLLLLSQVGDVQVGELADAGVGVALESDVAERFKEDLAEAEKQKKIRETLCRNCPHKDDLRCNCLTFWVMHQAAQGGAVRVDGVTVDPAHMTKVHRPDLAGLLTDDTDLVPAEVTSSKGIKYQLIGILENGFLVQGCGDSLSRWASIFGESGTGDETITVRGKTYARVLMAPQTPKAVQP